MPPPSEIRRRRTNEKYCRKWQQLGQRLRKRLRAKQVRTAFNPLDGHCGWSVPLLSLRGQTTLAPFAGRYLGFVLPPQFVPFSSALLQNRRYSFDRDIESSPPIWNR